MKRRTIHRLDVNGGVNRVAPSSSSADAWAPHPALPPQSIPRPAPTTFVPNQQPYYQHAPPPYQPPYQQPPYQPQYHPPQQHYAPQMQPPPYHHPPQPPAAPPICHRRIIPRPRTTGRSSMSTTTPRSASTSSPLSIRHRRATRRPTSPSFSHPASTPPPPPIAPPRAPLPLARSRRST